MYPHIEGNWIVVLQVFKCTKEEQRLVGVIHVDMGNFKEESESGQSNDTSCVTWLSKRGIDKSISTAAFHRRVRSIRYADHEIADTEGLKVYAWIIPPGVLGQELTLYEKNQIAFEGFTYQDTEDTLLHNPDLHVRIR